MKRFGKNKNEIIRYALFLVPVLLLVAWGLFNGKINSSTNPQGLNIYPPSAGLGNKIYIQPVGYVDHSILNAIRGIVAEDFKHPVEILNTMEIPHFPEGRAGQVKADYIRNYIADRKGVPKDTYRILAITDEDLYTDGYNFIFGQAAIGGIISIISIQRLIPQQDGGELIDGSAIVTNEIFQSRIRKLTRHELAHTFSLTHCSDTQCVMAFHDSLQTLDSGGSSFCEKCLSILQERKIGIHTQG
ncbi:MAG: archaemetzincin [bacterium]